MHCGTNDLDNSEPKAVINSITNSINKLSQRLISSKVIVSGLFPRKDFSNKEIYNIKLELLKRFQLLPNVHFVDHSNLLSQDETNLLVDKKHLNDTGIRLFAKNLKISIFGRRSRLSARPRRMPSPPSFNNARTYDFPENNYFRQDREYSHQDFFRGRIYSQFEDDKY